MERLLGGWLLRCALFVASIAGTSGALAASGTATGYGLDADLTLTVLLGVNAGIHTGTLPNPPAQIGSSPKTVVGISAGLGPLLTSPVLSSGNLTGSAQASLSGFNTDTVVATGEVDGTQLNVGILNLISILDVSAGVITSKAQASCASGATVFSGTADIANLGVSVLGVSVKVPAAFGPNTQVVDLSLLAGLSIVANEQIPTANGLDVNALHIKLSNYVLSALLNIDLDVVIAHSSVSMQSACAIPPAANLSLTKVAQGNFVRGGTGVYVLTATNNGSASSGAVTIVDTLPSALTYTGFSGSGWACSAAAQTVTCVDASGLLAGASSAVSINVAISRVAPNSVTNTAVVGSPDDPAPSCATTPLPGACASTTTPVQGNPHLILSKVANGSFVRGANGSYTLVATNSGDAAASGPLTITDTLPSGLTYSGASGSGWTCGASAQVVTCTNPVALIPGGSSQVILNVAIAASAPNSVTNKAVVGSPNDPAPSCTPPVDGCASTTTPVGDPPAQGHAHLILSKVANGSFVRGANASYTLTVTNTGSAAASAPISLTDNLPRGVSYISASGTGWTCAAATQVVTCSNPAVLTVGASSQVTLTVAIAPDAPGSVVNNADVGTPDQPPPSCIVLVDGCATTTTVVNDPPPSGHAHLILSKTANANFVRGSTGSYTLTVTNNGTVTATAPLTLIDPLPGGLTYVGAAGSGWSCAAAGQTVTCSNPIALAARAFSQVTITVAISAATPANVTNVASVGTPDQPPPACAPPVDGCGTVTTVVVDPPRNAHPLLALRKAHEDVFIVGQQGRYLLTLSNYGDAPTSGELFVDDQLPTGMTFVGTGGRSREWACSGSPSVHCSAGSLVLGAGATSTFELVVDVDVSAVGNAINHADGWGGGLDAPDCVAAPSSPQCASDVVNVTAVATASADPATGFVAAPVNDPLALLMLALILPWLARALLRANAPRRGE